jgi:small GTP-binding protein
MTPRKIMLLGEIGVGKSSIARRLVFDRFEADYKPTLGVDVYSYEIEDGPSPQPNASASAKFIIWDADGNFGDSILSHIYIKQAAGALIVGDVTRRSTLETMVQLGRSFMDAMPGRYCGYLVNKSDLASAAAELPGALAHATIPVLRTSAKTGENVKQAFLGAADAIRRRGL